MRDGWRQIALGDVAIRRKDFTPVRGDALYRIVGVQRSGWGLVDRDPVRGDSMKFGKLLELRTDDLVYRTITAFEAPSVVVSPEFEGAFVTPTTFPAYAFDHAQLLPGYMALLTTSPAFHDEMASRCVGSVLRRKTLSQGAFESIPVALPPFHEQRRIVDLIAALDDAIEASEGEAVAASRLLDATLDADASDSYATVGTIATISSGASWGKGDIRDADHDDASPVLTIANTKPDGSVSGEPTFVAGLSQKAGRLSHSTIVAIRTNGNHGRIGNVYRVPDRYVGAAVSAFQLIINPTYPDDSRHLFWMLRRPKFQAEVTAAASGSTGLGNIAATKLRAMEIPWPADAEARAVRVAMYEDMADSVGAARATADALRVLRSNLLTTLLSGEHEIPASYDELLEAA